MKKEVFCESYRDSSELSEYHYISGESLEDISCHTKVEDLGKIIGSGYNTIVIIPNKEYNLASFDNAVLVITREEQKYDYIESLCNEYQDLNCEELSSDSEMYKNIFEGYEKELAKFPDSEPNPWKLFYMTKLEVIALRRTPILTAMRKFTERHSENEYASGHQSLNIKEIGKEILRFKKYEILMPENEPLQMFKDLDRKVMKALKIALTALNKMNMKDNFHFDLHSEQFSLFNGELICIDPAIFNKDW